MLDKKIALVIGVCFAAVYAVSSVWLPTAYADADELLITGKLFSVAHPPGYAMQTSFYHILSRVFSNILPAIIMTAGTNVLAAISVALFYLLLRKLFPNQIIYSMIGTGIFGFSYLWWLYATVTEIGVLSVFLTISTLYAAISWYTKPNKLWFFLTWILFGLLVSHFVLAISLAPGLLLLLWSGDKKPKPSWLVGFLVGLFVYGLGNSLLWMQNQGTVAFSWNFPKNFDGWLNHMFLKDYYGTAAGNATPAQSPLISVFSAEFYQSIGLYLKYLIEHFTIVGFGFGLFGLATAVWKRDTLWWALCLMWFLSGIYLAGYMGISRPDFNQTLLQGIAQRQFLVSEMVFAVFVVGGIKGIKGRKGIREGIGIGLIGLLVFTNRSVIVDKEFRILSYSIYHEALQAVEPNAIIICTSDISCYNLLYQTIVQQFRPDVLVVLQTTDYQKKYIQAHPEIYPFNNLNGQDFLPQLIAWNLPKRPVYITEGIPEYIDYSGFEVGPLYLEPSGWLAKITLKPNPILKDLVVSNSIKQLILRHDKKDTYGAGILHIIGNSLAYNGYLSLRYGDTKTAASYLTQAQIFDSTNEQTTYLQQHKDELLKELAIDTDPSPASDYAQAATETNDVELSESYSRRAFYLAPKNQEYVKQLADIYRRMGDDERSTVFEEYLDHLVKNGLR